jgi:hypothetical protein
MIRRREFLKTSAAALIYTAANPGPSQSPAQAVSFDNRSVIVASQRKLLACGEVHYPRSTRAMWPSILERSKALGLNTIATYVFWNYHESFGRCAMVSPNSFCFTTRQPGRAR